MIVSFANILIFVSCHDPKNEALSGCLDVNACNYNILASTENNSCWFPELGCSCDDPIGAKPDCLGYCDIDESNNPPENLDGNCQNSVIDQSGCTNTEKCNYEINMIYDNGSCAPDFTDFGGNYAGIDCYGDCNGTAVNDNCGNCVGNNLILDGQSWLIDLDIKAIFSDGSISSQSARLGASIYASDNYNTIIEQHECSECYSDVGSVCALQMENSLCFYFPHIEWEENENLIANNSNLNSDIRFNNVYDIMNNGMEWTAQISSDYFSQFINLDTLIIEFDFFEGINSCDISLRLENNLEYEVINKRLELGLGLQDITNLTFNIKNICFN